MPSEMLDRLQEKKLRSLEVLLVDAWGALLPRGNEKNHAGAIADFVVDEGIGVRQGMLRLWEYHWSMALAGEMPERREFGTKLRPLLEWGQVILSRAASVARCYAELSGLEVARLSQFEEQAKTYPVWVQECMARWEMLDRAHLPLNNERIARSREAYQRGECKTVDAIVTRLEHGGPLLKE